MAAGARGRKAARPGSARGVPPRAAPGALDVAFVVPEATPFAGHGAGADLGGLLPVELARRGHRVRVFLPGYAGIDRPGGKLARHALRVEVPVGDRMETAAFERTVVDGAEFLFVRKDDYFGRPGMYGDGDGPFVDNPERFSFFVRAALAALDAEGPGPGIVHAHGWPCALAPVYLAGGKRLCVLGIHDAGNQAVCDPAHLHQLHLPRGLPPGDLEWFGRLHLLKAGLLHAAAVLVPSRRAVEELQTEEHGEGLEAVFRAIRARLGGMPDGVSYAGWDPGHDRYLKANYGADDLVGRRSCKMDLQGELGLPSNVNALLLGLGGPLVESGGIDLVLGSLPRLLGPDVQLAVTGTGERRYEDRFRDAAARHPGQIGFRAEWTDLLRHKLYAGADLLLFPARSRSDAADVRFGQRYGALAAARGTGALDDAVVDVDDAGTGAGGADVGAPNGFKFGPYRAEALAGCVERAGRLYQREPERWQRLVQAAMREDHSWAAAASAHEELYRSLSAGVNRSSARPA